MCEERISKIASLPFSVFIFFSFFLFFFLLMGSALGCNGKFRRYACGVVLFSFNFLLPDLRFNSFLSCCHIKNERLNYNFFIPPRCEKPLLFIFNPIIFLMSLRRLLPELAFQGTLFSPPLTQLHLGVHWKLPPGYPRIECHNPWDGMPVPVIQSTSKLFHKHLNKPV